MLNEKITILANAKLNLYLDIVGTRSDGYHTLETVMQSVDLCDVVEVTKTRGGITVTCSNPQIPQGEGNICHKAAKLFLERFGGDFGVNISIEKRIPSGAGLGGGSADAAAVLRAMSKLSGLELRVEELLELAAANGADVPFCLVGGTAICRGIGEKITLLKEFPQLSYLIIQPHFACDTRAAYKMYDESPVAPKQELEKFCNAGKRYPSMMYNVFEEIYGNPEISEIKAKLLKTGALGSLLTGSGSSVFGVYETAQQAVSAAREFPDMFTAAASSASSGSIDISAICAI